VSELASISPTERALRGLGHLALGSAGAYGFFVDLPNSLNVAAEPWQLAVWACFMLTAVIGAVAALSGRFLWEYVTLPFMGGGSLVYLFALGWAVSVDGNPSAGVAFFFVLALVCYVAARFFSLWRLTHRGARESPEGGEP
jgi:hypothetical protein